METVATTSASIRTGDRSAVETVASCLACIEAKDDEINAFREVYGDRALEKARAIDKSIASGNDPGPLAGVPIAVKDNIVTDFGTTACGSRILETYRSPYTATAVSRLESAGAIIIGKTNCDEFAMGSSTEHCSFGPVRNPWAPDRVPGGSSGGSAAAVAAGMCPAALGSDTGGSIRQPAALCGVVGMKPSYGRVSRYGLVAFGSSLDQIGPLASSVADAAALAAVISGADTHDATSVDRPVSDLAAIERPVEGLRLGVARRYPRDENHPAVAAAVTEAIETMRGLGATIVDVDLPLTDYGIATYYVLAPAEASSNLARFDGIRYGRRAESVAGESLFDLYARSRAEGFGPEVQRRIMLGTYVLSAGYYDAYYKRAQLVRQLIRAEFDAAFARCDAIIGPTSPAPAFPIGSKSDPLTMYLCDVYTANTNIAGICGISVPAGFADVDGTSLPVGVQFQCQAFEEETLLRVARMYEARAPMPSASSTGADGLVVGVDLGGTNAQFGVVDAANTIVGRTAAKTEASGGLEHTLDLVHHGIVGACAAAGVAVDRVDAIGVAAAGAIDIPRGVVLSAPNLGWQNVPLRDLLAERLGRPIMLDNDVNGAVWGEYHLGPAAGRGDALGVWVGTGVGGGLVLDGRLHHGAFFTAGEIGHTILIPDAPRGARTVEDNCSRTAFRAQIAKETGAGEMDTNEIAAAYAARDPVITRIIDRGADLLGIAIANWITMLAIDRVILGGGMTEALGAMYIDRVRASFGETVFPPRCRDCRIDVTRLQADAGLLGAAMLARNRAS